ncbi:hypothetical protein MUK42_13823 [Musa troglodytarum]|uniref:Uncharacterized protein n=1 Tax=Musa troglodytarum TaxID=320322 RepID=A0A9E7HBM3_9LILI|nr:hypothetical protein MUK42_13823 [Musa troglodytarum]
MLERTRARHQSRRSLILVYQSIDDQISCRSQGSIYVNLLDKSGQKRGRRREKELQFSWFAGFAK